MPAAGSEPVIRSLTLAPHLSEAARGRALVAEIASQAGFPEDRVFDITVACSEAIANAIEHSPVKGEVQVRTILRPDRLEVEVQGPGEFQAPDRLKKRETRGLGLPLMAKLSDHLALFSGPKGETFVSLTFYLPGFRSREETDTVTPPWIRELVEENELVAAITGTVPVGLYVTDPELRFRWTNAAYLDFLEEPYRSQPLEGIYIGDAVPGSEEMGSLEILRTVSRTGAPAFFPEYEYVGFTRGTTYWRWEILPLKQNRLEPPYDVLVVIAEITEQVLQRRKVEAASRSYTALAENGGFAFALCRTVLDAAGNAVDFEYVEVNDAHETFTGHPAETFVGKRVTEAIPGYSREMIDRLNRVALTGEPSEEEIYEPYLERWYRLNTYSPEPGHFASLARDITEHKQAEEALRSSEKTFAELVERSPFGTYIVDSEFRMAFMNSRSQTTTFRNVRPLIGRPFTEVMHTLWPDDVAEDIISHFRHTLETGEPYYSTRFTNPRHDVEIVESYEWELQRIALPDGQYGVICYYFDSTELRTVQDALQQRSQLLDLSSDATFAWELDGAITYWNRGAERLYGFKPEEAVGRASHELLQTIFPQGSAPVRAALETDGEWIGEITHTAKDGSVLVVESRQQVIDAGDSRLVLETNRDITERKQAEEARRNAEDKFRTLFDSMDEGYCLIEMIYGETGEPIDWLYLEANPAFERQSGLRAPGKTVVELIGAVEPFWLQFYARIAETGEPQRTENRVEAIDRWYAIFAARVGPPGSRRLGVLFDDITERKRAEAQRLLTEERYRSLAENIPSVLMRYDRDLRVVYLSPQAAPIIGIPVEQFLGKTNREVGMPDDLCDLWESAIRRVFDTGTAEELEFSILSADGTTRAFLLKLALERGSEEGKVDHVLGISTEITERKGAEEKLRQSEARFRAVQDNSIDRFTILKPFYNDRGEIVDFTYVYQNARAAEATGRSPEELVGRRMTETFPAFPATPFFAMYKQAVETGQALEFEERYDTDGVDEWFHASVTPVPDGIAVATEIITERKRAEEALRKSDADFRSLFGASPDAIFMAIPGGPIIAANPAACAMFEMTEEELCAAGRPGIEDPNDPAPHAALRERAQSGKVRYEATHVRKSGARFPSEVTSVLVEGRTRSIVVIRDLTERKQAEEELRESEERSAFLLELADALRPIADPAAAQEAASRLLGEYLKADRVTYFEVRGDDYVVERDYAPSVPHLSGRYPIAAFGERLLTTYRAGRMVVSNDIAKDPIPPEERDSFLSIQVHAQISVPLIKNGEFVAGLAVHSATPRTWKPLEMRLMEEAAERTWAAAERARAEKALKATNEELVRFNNVAVDRELRVISLKGEVNELLAKAGMPRRYSVDHLECDDESITNSPVSEERT